MERVGLKKYFQKKNCKYEILNHLYFGPSFVFWGMPCGVLASVFLNSSSMFNHGGRHFYSALRALPHHIKTSYGPVKTFAPKKQV